MMCDRCRVMRRLRNHCNANMLSCPVLSCKYFLAHKFFLFSRQSHFCACTILCNPPPQNAKVYIITLFFRRFHRREARARHVSARAFRTRSSIPSKRFACRIDPARHVIFAGRFSFSCISWRIFGARTRVLALELHCPANGCILYKLGKQSNPLGGAAV